MKRVRTWIYFFEKVSPVKFFIIAAAIFGVLFVAITPPFQGADEEVHFYRAYQISEGNFVIDIVKGGAGGSLPTSLGAVAGITQTPAIQFYPQLKYDIHKTREAFKQPLDERKKKIYTYTAATQYSPVPYVAQSAGIAVARLLRLPALGEFYAARLGGLVAWIVLMSLAIALIPRKKWVLVSIGLLPMALFQASTINVDALTIGSGALVMALVLKYREKVTKLSRRDIALLAVALVTMVLTKEVMAVFLPLVFLIKTSSFRSPIFANLTKLFLIILPIGFLIAWGHVIHNIDVTAAYFNNQNPSAQIKFVTKSPFSFINVLWNEYFYSWGDNTVRSFIGVFGWSDAPLSELISTIGYIGLFLLFFSSDKKKESKWLTSREKSFVGLLAIGYALAASAALYIYNSPVGFKIIVGLQGRYFIPSVLLLIPVCYGQAIKVSTKFYRRLAIFAPIFLLVSSTITIFVRYFVSNV